MEDGWREREEKGILTHDLKEEVNIDEWRAGGRQKMEGNGRAKAETTVVRYVGRWMKSEKKNLHVTEKYEKGHIHDLKEEPNIDEWRSGGRQRREGNGLQ